MEATTIEMSTCTHYIQFDSADATDGQQQLDEQGNDPGAAESAVTAGDEEDDKGKAEGSEGSEGDEQEEDEVEEDDFPELPELDPTLSRMAEIPAIFIKTIREVVEKGVDISRMQDLIHR